MPIADWLDEDARLRIATIFREHGVDDADVYVASQIDPAEIVFVVGPAAVLPEATLTKALTEELKRKVWVTTNGPSWEDQIEPLVPIVGI
jgi:hypothetical protein